MKKIEFFIFLMLIIVNTNACTTFFMYVNGKMVFGRNYDWIADEGMVCTNQRGLAKTSMIMADGNTITWVSRYGSITFNQYGKEFPTGGMNEKGLVVELMWLDATIYPQPDDRPTIGVLQWIQYQLDNHASVDQVIKSDANLRITSKGTPLHYLVADADGHTATIEFLNGKLEVHRGSDLPLPVLTNDTYSHSFAHYSSGTVKGNNSLERFSTACNIISQYKTDTASKSIIDASFEILNKVQQGDYTKWSIVYDITEKKIWYTTQRFNQRRSISFAAFDFSCESTSRHININGMEQGDISNLFNDFSNTLNQQILENAALQSSSQVPFLKPQIEAILAYPAAIICK
jgi:choloylglycine hydrolase